VLEPLVDVVELDLVVGSDAQPVQRDDQLVGARRESKVVLRVVLEFVVDVVELDLVARSDAQPVQRDDQLVGASRESKVVLRVVLEPLVDVVELDLVVGSDPQPVQRDDQFVRCSRTRAARTAKQRQRQHTDQDERRSAVELPQGVSDRLHASSPLHITWIIPPKCGIILRLFINYAL